MLVGRSIRRFDERAVNSISTRPVAAVSRARAVEEGAPGRRVAVRGRVPVPEVTLVVVQAHEPVKRVPDAQAQAKAIVYAKGYSYVGRFWVPSVLRPLEHAFGVRTTWGWVQ